MNSVFDRKPRNHLTDPLFFGGSPNVARYETHKYPAFDRFTEKQLGFFWRPEEINLAQDHVDYQEKLEPHMRHIWKSNLEYQILMDSVQGRAPALVLGPIVSLPDVETWIQAWTFSETIHSRSYTHGVRNVLNDPSETFDIIVENPAILDRAEQVSRYYDELHEINLRWELHGTRNVEDHRRAVIRCLYSINVLEAIRFYGSFACSFLFAKSGLMEGMGKIMKLIARDEALHHSSTNYILQLLSNGSEGDEWARSVENCRDDALQIFDEAIQQELDWSTYLFQHGSMLGLNEQILDQYIKYTANKRMDMLNLGTPYDAPKHDPLPWMAAYLSSDNVQVTPQEVENSRYLIGQVDSTINANDLADFDM